MVITDNDTFNYKEILQQPDVGDFLCTMIDEFHDHTTHPHCVLLLRDNIDKNNIISDVWSLKQKGLPEGTRKYTKQCYTPMDLNKS